MKLTPLEIKKQEFKKSFRGYDAIEVDAFLEMVSDELESLVHERNGLADEVLKLRTQLRDYQSVEKTLQDTLLSAQESIRESKANSSREAGMLIKEAELKAEKILDDAKYKLAEMKNELVMVKAQKDSFARRLRHLLESQLDLIHVLELDDLGFGKYETKQTRNPALSKVDHETKSEKIEFKAIDDTYIKSNSNEETKIYKEKAAENTSGLHRNKPEVGKEPGDLSEQEKRKTKISDQLLF